MKKIILLFATALCVLCSCQKNDTPASILGKWHALSLHAEDYIDGKFQDEYNEDFTKDDISYYEFKNDGSYEFAVIEHGQGEPIVSQKGNYEFDGSILKNTYFEQGHKKWVTETYSTRIEGNKLTLTMTDINGKYTEIIVITLERMK